MQYILAIDEGTTGTKSMVVDENLNVIAESILGFEQHFPKPGWVEHDLEEIWAQVIKTIKSVVQKIDVQKIGGIGITNQRETLCFWDRKTGTPLGRAIVWQDRRTAELCKTLKEKNLEPHFQESTGLLLDPYFSGTKAAWALENWPDVKNAYKAGKLAIGTIDSYLTARLSNGQAHVTEPSNASRTLCFHLKDHTWDSELCSTLNVPKEVWPEVQPSIGVFAKTKNVPGLPDGIPISGILGDQQSALLGQACIYEGMAKCTYGTGAFILLNTGHSPRKSQNRLLTTVAWALNESDYTYALEGSAFMAGATVQWLRDGLKIIDSAPEIESLASEVGSSEGVFLVPSFTGLGAPHWDSNATGMITGITRGTTRAHIARAALEGIALQNADILTAMQADLGTPLTHLKVDGGACANNLLMQYQSDVLNVPLKRPTLRETTSLGAIFAAGLGIGLWKNLSDIEKTWKEDRTFEPSISSSQREAILERWKTAVARVRMGSH